MPSGILLEALSKVLGRDPTYELLGYLGTSGTPLPIAEGGTGSATAAAALAALAAFPDAACVVKHNGVGTAYTTPALAVAAAVSGDTIYVQQSATVTANLAKGGVNWWFAPSITITRSNATPGFIFDDGGTAMTFTIDGAGNFTRDLSSVSAVADGDSGVLKVSHASSDIIFNFNEVKCTANLVAVLTQVQGAILQTAGKLTTNGRSTRFDIATGGASNTLQYALWWKNGEWNGRIDRVDTTYPTADQNIFGFGAEVTAAPTGDFRLSIEEMSNANFSDPINGSVIYSKCSNASAASWITAKTIKGSIQNVGGKFYLTDQKHFGQIYQDASVGTSELHYSIDKIGVDFSSSAQAVLISGGTAWLTVRKFDPGTNWAELVKVTAGTAYLTSEDLTAASSKDAVLVSGGTLNILSGVITNGGGGKNDLKRTGGTLAISPSVSGPSGTPLVISGAVSSLSSINGTVSAYAAGTAYSLTNTSAALTFGTTQPSITINKAGRWLLEAQANLQDNGATFASSRTVTCKLRRTNNTAADVTNGSDSLITGVVTTLTAQLGKSCMKADYRTANTDDAVTIFGDVSAAPSAGSVDCVAPGTWIRATWLGPETS